MWVISSCPCCSIHLGTSTSTRFLLFAPMNLTEPIANVPSCNNVNYENAQESPPPHNFHQCRLPRVFSFSKGVRLSGDFACLSAATSVVTFQKLSPSYHQHLIVKQISIYDTKCFTKIPPLPKKCFAIYHLSAQAQMFARPHPHRLTR